MRRDNVIINIGVILRRLNNPHEERWWEESRRGEPRRREVSVVVSITGDFRRLDACLGACGITLDYCMHEWEGSRDSATLRMQLGMHDAISPWCEAVVFGGYHTDNMRSRKEDHGGGRKGKKKGRERMWRV